MHYSRRLLMFNDDSQINNKDVLKPDQRRWGGRIMWGLTVVAVIGGGYFLFNMVKKESLREAEQAEQASGLLPEVTVRPFGELVSEAKVEKIATIEPAVSAPLVARMGGRVSRIEKSLGREVKAGQVVVRIDSGVEANPTRVQISALQESLAMIDKIEQEALRAADNGIKTASLAVEAAQAGGSLSLEQTKKAREQADVAYRRAELSYQDAVEAKQRIDQVVRAADIGLKTARLARDQATIAVKMAGQKTNDGLKQAQQGLKSAQDAKQKIKVDMQAQRVSLRGQIAVANEQVRLAQIISPVAGQITRLTVRQGDYVRPGQEVGEVIAFAGAQIQIDVTTGVRRKLAVGDELIIKDKRQEFTGVVARLADGPRTDMALWQVDIFVTGTPQVVQQGDLVVVELPVGETAKENSLFLPLDAVVVRQEGVLLMTVDKDGMVSTHVVTPISYVGDYVEGVVEIDDSAMVVVEGGKTLREGDRVRVRS